MKTLTVNSTGDGTARVENPFNPYSPKHAPNSDFSEYDQFSMDNPPLPIFRDGKQLFEAGTFEVEIRWQYKLNYMGMATWENIPVPISELHKGFPTRQIFNVVTVATTEQFNSAPVFEAISEAQRHTATTDTSPAIVSLINEADNSQGVDKQLLNATEKTSRDKTVEKLADMYTLEKYAVELSRFRCIEDVEFLKAEMAECKTTFIAGHIDATESFKHKVTEVVENYAKRYGIPVSELIELIKAL